MAERVEKNSAEAIEQLQELVSKVRIAMMATINAGGVLSCRPMTTISAEDDGSLWFMTNESSGKVSDQHNNHIVHLMYSDPSSNTYFHVYGSSEEVTDRTMIRKLWSPLLKAWYPQGPDDPDLCLLKVMPQEARFWDSSSNKMVVLFNMLKAIAGHERYQEQEGKTGNLHFNTDAGSIH